MYEFDQDTHVSEVEPGRYRARLTDRWSIGPIANGGYVMAVVSAAVREELRTPDPLTATVHFLRPAPPGDAEVVVDVAKRGRSVSTASARLLHDGKECARVLATYGDLDTLSSGGSPEVVTATPPDLSGLGRRRRPAGLHGEPKIAERLDTEYVESTMAWLRGETGPMETRGRVRFHDGRPPCVSSLSLFSDAMPPPAFNAIPRGWVPTLELTVHVRARPVPGWLSFRFSTRVIVGGLLEEDGELWDEAGRLVAMSRQLAAMPRTPAPMGGAA